MKIIITMAGEGKRFKEIGINVPKYQIICKGRTLFEWALLSLKHFSDFTFIFITRKKHNSSNFINEKCKVLNIVKFHIVELEQLTKGQADTVLTAKELLNLEEQILIYNIDTYVEPGQLKPSLIKGDGWVPCFEAIGNHWSFINFNDKMEVKKITEKVRISNYGTIGLYYFSSFKLFLECYNSFNYNVDQERYIAPLYSHLIANKKKKVYTNIIHKDSVNVLGTPEEIMIFDPNWVGV